jgi:hypothetical protein
MVCRTVDVGGGAVAIVCSRGRQKPLRCAWCKAPAGILCDEPLSHSISAIGGAEATCSKPLCSRHAYRCHIRGASYDFCPDHRPPGYVED